MPSMTSVSNDLKYLLAGLVQNLVQGLPSRQDNALRILLKLTRGRAPAIVNRARMRLDVGEFIQRNMFLGTYEPRQTAWFRECLRPGDTVVDVGASFGYYTTLGAELVGPAGRVFAFEPSPIASKVIENAIRDSGIANVVLTKAALGRAASTVSLFMPNTPHLHSPSILPTDKEFVPVEVPVMRLDQFEPLRDRPIKLLKMDVEGYEPNVLDGMTGLIEKGQVHNVICEFNSYWLERNSTTPAELLARFHGHGFKIREQSALNDNLVGHKGAHFELQDIWFARANENA
jgi:FkbM family methyltransferase